MVQRIQLRRKPSLPRGSKQRCLLPSEDFDCKMESLVLEAGMIGSKNAECAFLLIIQRQEELGVIMCAVGRSIDVTRRRN